MLAIIVNGPLIAVIQFVYFMKHDFGFLDLLRRDR